MKLKDFIKELMDLDQELEVIISKDSEGNRFSPYSSWCDGIYVPDSTYSGEFFDNDDCDADHGIKAIVLWPTN